MSHLSFPPMPAWTGRDDGFGPERFHQCIQAVELDALVSQVGRPVALVGFACDEGVKRNHGRIGAAQGPEFLRRSLANFAWNPQGAPTLFDVGDVFCTDSDLEGAQQELGRVVSALHTKNCLPFVLGGGHETAWGHFQGLAQHHKNTLIINFDAHYDLRPLIDGSFGSSGTPFTQIAQHCQDTAQPFHYCVIGLQEGANTASLRERAAIGKVHSIFAQQLHHEGWKSVESDLIRLISSHDTVYLSICLDVFAQAYAPGVSAPQALGLLPTQVLPLLQCIAASGKLVGVDIVELCPPQDRDMQTARLGAALIYEVLKHLKKN